MPFLQTLRQARVIALWLVAWLVLLSVVAVASPMVKPQAYATVCTAIGSALLANAEGLPAESEVTHALDCVLCLPWVAPPVHGCAAAAILAPLARAQITADVAIATRRSGAALPARGPPIA